MNTKQHSKLITVILVALLILGSLACSVSGEVEVDGPTLTPAPVEATTEETAAATAESPETPAEVAPTEDAAATTEDTAPTPEPETTEAVAPPETLPVVPPPGVEDPLELAAAEIPELSTTTLDPTSGGMGNLGTFRQRMHVAFTAEDTGLAGAYHYDAEVNTGQQAVHLVLSAEGPYVELLPSAQVAFLWIGPRLWVKAGNQPWIPVPEDVAAARFDEQSFSVGDFLPYALHFTRVGEETINGIATAHYTYSAENLPTDYGAVSGSGDIYVALDGGYVVRYTLDAAGTFEEYFDGNGAIHLTYDTYDVGAAIDIQPPRR